MRQFTNLLLVMLFLSSTVLFSQQNSAGLTGHDLDQYKIGLMNQPVAERAPGTYTGNEIIASDADFDLQFEFACGDASGEAGVETDGTYIYTTKWNGAGFFKYELNGTFLGAFQVGSVSGIRDLAYDGTYFYGGAAATTVYKMDFNTNTLISQWTAPVAVRAIGFDELQDGFWANNWSTTLTLFSRTGAVIATIPTQGNESFYGLAYDPQGPFLWGHSQRVGTSQNILYKYALPSGTFILEFDVFPLLSIPVTGDIAGGLAFHPNLVSGFYSIVGIVQNKCIWGLEMGPTGPPAGTDVGVQMIVSPNSGVSLGTEQVSFTIKNFGTNSVSNIPWTITWTGQGSGQYSGTYAGPLAGGAEATINPGTANLSAYGTYNFEACTNLAGDENPGNNCKTKAVVNAEPSLCVDNLYTSGCSFGDGLTSWDLENITVANIPCAGTPPWYQNYMDQIHNLEKGNTYVLTVTAGYADTYFDVWIDFDGNLELNNANEQVLNDGICAVAGTVYTFNITIPADAPNGTYVLRARTNWTAAVVGACDTYSYGNCIDFKANITGGGGPVLDPPQNLMATLQGNDAVLLTWEAPEEPGTWLQWCSDENNDGIGLTDGGTFIVAARWVASDLTMYNGQHLTKVALFPRSDLGATFTLKIYKGANAGTMLVNMPLTGLTQDEWNEIMLTTPVVVDASAELWVGYEVTHVTGDYPAGCDAGPAVANKGDMISLDAGATWSPLSGFGLDYNWNIKAFVTDATDASVAQPIAQNVTYNYNRSQLKAGNLKPALNTGMRAPDSYKVYRDGVAIATGITGLSYTDAGLAQGTYSYEVTAVYPGGESEPAGPVSIYVPGAAVAGISFNPTSLVENHANPNTVTTQTLMVTNTGGAPLTFDIAVQRSSTAGPDAVIDPEYVAQQYIARMGIESGNIERAPGTYPGNEIIASDADFDLQFEFACGDASGEAGVETDGNYIYTTKWNGAGFFKYELNGTFLGAFQVGSVNAIRDLAYDGTYFYGGAAATTVYKMDFNTNTLISQFTAPVAVRAIGYDEGEEGFWANNWSTTITLFQETGAVLNTIPTNGDESFYGFAYDPQGPYLWGYSQRVGTSQNILYKYSLPSGAFLMEFDVFPLLSIPVTGDIAGGLAFHPDLVTGYYSIVGIVQNKCIWGLEMGTTTPPSDYDVALQSIVSPNSGVSLTGSEPVVIKIKNIGGVPVSNIPWTVTWSGQGSGSFNGTYAGPLAAGAEVDVTAGTADLSAYGTYNFEACVNLSNDPNPSNNCKTKAVVNAEPSLCVDNLYTSGCSFGDGLTSWDLENIIVANIPCAGTPPWYQNYMDQIHNLEAGNTYVLTVTAGYADTYFDVWIDFDGNLELNNANELVLNDGICAVAGTVYTFNITIPADAPGGTYVLRARTNWTAAVVGACDTYSYGNCVDFKANIGGGQPTDWLSAAPLTGTVAPGNTFPVTVTFNSTGLASPSTHNGALVFTSNAPGSPHNVPATLNVGGAPPVPVMSLNPTSLTETHTTPPQVTTKTVTVTNTGGGTLEWDLTINRASTAGPDVVVDPEYVAAKLAERRASEGAVISAANGVPGGVSPNMTDDEIIRYDDGTNADAIGLTAGGTFHVSAYWPASTMGQYAGMELDAVEIFVYDAPTSMTLNIYGAGTPTTPGALLHSQPIAAVAQTWVMTTLTTPVDITGADIWIGYEVTHTAGTFCAGVDPGPAVAGFGDMISLAGGTYESMSISYGLNYNWNIAGYLVAGGPALTKDVGVQTIISPNSGVALGTESVVIKVKNFGTAAQSNIPWSVTWTGAGSGSLSGTIPGPLAGGADIDVTAGTANLTAFGTYNFEACTSLAGDENPANNCKTKAVVNAEPSLCVDNLYTSGCSFGDGLTSWDLENITVASIPCAGTPPWYQNYMDQIHSLEAGMTYVLTVTAGYADTYFDVWIDFDGNLELNNDNELVLNDGLCAVAGTVYTFDITIPANAPGGTYVMRARTNWTAAVTGPCDTYSYGNCIDFKAEVGGGSGGGLITETFEDYNAGTYLVQQAVAMGRDYWTTWSNTPGTAEDPFVSNAQAFAGSNSMVVEGTNDAVLLFGDKTEGNYDLTFNMYIPTGFLGYFNLLHAFAGASSEWGLQVYFDQGGAGLVDAAGAGAATFTFGYDTWIPIKVNVNLDEDWCMFYVNNSMVVEYQWSLGTFGTAGLNQLAAANFYAWNVGGTPKYYIDHIELVEAGAPVEEWLTAQPTSGSLAAGQSMDVTVTFNSTGLEIPSVHNGALVFTSNAAGSPHTVPATLNVGGAPPVPVMSLNPTQLTEVHLDPPQVTTKEVLVTNAGGGTLTWDLTVQRSSTAGPDAVIDPEYVAQQYIARMGIENGNIERAPGTYPGNEIIASDADFDLQFEFACGDASGEAGVETDGNYIYTTKWNGAGFFKYELNGTFLGAFQVGSVNAIRDLAYDGTYFYGGAAATTVYKMDFNTNTLIGQFTAPVAVRAIGYDEGEGGFWANNWSTTITLFDQTGAVLSTIPTNGDESFYGFAYDPQGPYLWGYSQRVGTSQNILYKYSLPSGAFLMEFDVFPLLSIPVTGDIAGGLAFHPDLVTGYYSIVGIVQNKCIWGLEMGVTGPPAGTDVGVQMIVSPNSGVSLGTEQVTITIKNFGTNTVSNIPWTITWAGQGSGQYSGTYAGPLAGGAEATINPGTANLSAYGTYNFEACTNLAGDENPGNNCKTKAVVNAEPSLCVDNLYTSGCSFGDGLTSWDLENITVANIPCAGTPPWYQNYMDQIHNLEAGNTYVLTVTAGYADTYFDVWIDFDGNLELNNANELVLNDGICAVAGTVYTFNITIPADAPGGTYVMRARTNWTAAVVGACDTYSYGNCVDFKANIGGGQPTDWLSAMPLSGSLGAGQSQIVTVTFNSTGLEVPSIHNGSLIFASNAAGSPHTVPATLVVGGEGPIIVLNPTSLTENHPTPPQQTTQVVNVSNPGTEALTFDIAIQRSSTAGPDVVVDPEYVAAKLAERRAADGIVLGAANGVPGGVSPNMTDDEIIRYDDGTNADAIGLTAGGTFHVSAYWPASTMGQYAGMKLDAVEIFVYDAPTSMTLNIYGAGTPTTPGALLHSQPIAAVAQTWVMTTLTTPVDITGADIWIGYEVTHTAGTFCAGVDPGPAVAGFGDMISLAGGTYESMSISYGLNYNWNIAGYLVAGGPQLTNDVGVQTIISPNSGVALGTESVVIKVKNFGTAAQSNIPWSVTWTGAGSGSLSGTIPGPLAGGADIDVTAGTANLAAFGTYNFEACTNLAGDENAANNCKTKAVVNAEPSLCVDNLYTSGCSFGDGLTSWDLENITVANIPCAGTPPWYQDYTNMLHILEAGNTYVLTVTAGYADTYFDVWIDFDGNLELNNANELVLNDGLCAIAGTVYTFNLTIPADAPNGEFVMRARTNWIDPVTGACDTYSYGNCVDFKAEVGGGTPGGWLTADPMMGTVPAGGSMNVNVHFNSTGVNPGTYNGALIFTSNAPTSPTNLPVTFIVGQPTGGLTVNPTAINASHYAAPQVTQHILNATNTGTTPIAWNLVIDRDGSIGFKYATEYVKGLPPVSHPSAFERAPGTAYGNETIHSDADYDLQFEFACGDASGEAGVETDGNYIYTTKWNGAGFFKYELDGTFLGAFQVGSVSAIRDLAYDGMYFYGGAAATTVYKMDFNTNTLIGQFTAPVAVRAIGYDEGADGFWANNWSTTLTLFDDAGAVLNTIATNGDESFYGLAYDPQGPFLWGYSQRVGTSQNILYKYNIATGAKIEEFDVFPLLSIPITGDIAGGLAFHPDLVTGYYSIVGIVQNKCIWGLEMGMTPAPVEWLTASPMSGTTGAGQTSQITVSLNSEGLEAGVTYTGAVIFNTNSPVTPTVTVPVSLYVSGVGVGEPITDESMLMYPNPASDVLNIEATGIKHVMILNNLGQVVYDRPADNDNVQINTSNFGTGVYVVRIKTADKSYTEKLIIQ